MADVATSEGNLLTRKAGPMPVWVWGLIGLAVAWAFAKYRDLKSAAAAAQQQPAPGAAASSESQQVAPQFIIEENLPTVPVSISGIPSAPVTQPTTPPLPVTTPPGTAPKPPVATKPAAPPPPKGTRKKPPLHYIVHHGDTLGSIAARYGTNWQHLYQYNTTPGVRPADTIATLKQRGPNLLYAGETILIPQ